MFDRDAYMKKYYGDRYNRRKEQGKCTKCGVALSKECVTLLCEPCREKQKHLSKVQWQNEKRRAFAELKKKYTESESKRWNLTN